MPSATLSKRSRRAAFDDDASDVEYTVTQAASSSLRNNETQRKKARLSSGNAGRKARRAVDEEDDDEPMGESELVDEQAPPSTQYEIIRDQGFKHLANSEQDDQRATQRLKERPTIIGENHAAQNAIIESITCMNFMCHTRLHVEIGPLLNFIVGENGSGKSAVLTAITLCLGGQASATNRGGSLKSFVKEGEKHACLIVKLKNSGEDAYKPELYGESIIFERWFTKEGSSGFKVKSATGRIISTKKADADDIVEYYCLQVDNPLNVLSQDNARSFLNSASPATKFSFFNDGTQLQKMDDDYKLFTERIEALEVQLGVFEDDVGYKKEKYEKAVKLRDAVSKAVEMRNKAQLYQKQLVWAQVEEQEHILQQKERAIIAAQGEIDRTEQIIAEKARVLESFDDKIQHAEEALETARQEENRAKVAEEEAKERYDEAKKVVTEFHVEERAIHGNLTSNAQSVKECEGKIKDEERKLEQMNGGLITKKQSELDKAVEALEGIDTSIGEEKVRLKGLEEDAARAAAKVKDPADVLWEKKKAVDTARNQLRTLQQSRKDPLDSFDSKTRQLLKVIEDDHGFTQKPIGPLGRYIQLTKAQWMPILEKTLNSALNSFLVGNKADHTRLMAHIDRLRMTQTSVFISNCSIDNLREPDERFDTILRVLKFDNKRVRDQLIINFRIEQTLLIEDREEAERVVFDESPANSGGCLTLHDKKKGWGLRITGGGGRNFASNPLQPLYNAKPRMKTDHESQVRYYEGLVNQLEAEYREAENSKQAAHDVEQGARKAVELQKQLIERLKRERNKAQVVINNIQTEIDSMDGSDNRLQGLKEQLKSAQERMDHYGNQFAEVAIKKREINEEAERLKEELNQARVVSRDQKAHVVKASDKVARYTEARRLALSEKNMAHEAHDMSKLAKTKAEESRNRQAETVDDYNRQASGVAPERVHIPEGETYQSIERKYEAIREQRKKLTERMGGSEEEINERATQATTEYRAAKKNLKDHRMMIDLYKHTLMHRLARFRDFQRHVSAQARCNFSYLLSERGFRGQLLLDHRARKLEVIVEPDKTRENGRGRNTKTLSGGEKSFSSICLLLAIWDAMGSPLRCLDEFDVFMDNVNRAISTNMLITAARRSVGKQFILITPNAIEGRANLDKDVKIIRLTDPRQQRLPEMIH